VSYVRSTGRPQIPPIALIVPFGNPGIPPTGVSLCAEYLRTDPPRVVVIRGALVIGSLLFLSVATLGYLLFGKGRLFSTLTSNGRQSWPRRLKTVGSGRVALGSSGIRRVEFWRDDRCSGWLPQGWAPRRGHANC